jgi:hypothetical protein
MQNTDLENYKKPDLKKIEEKLQKFQEMYNEEFDLIEQDYHFTEYSKNRHSLVVDVFKEIVYYVAIPFETFIDILKDEQNNLYISFGIDFSLIKNSLLAKTKVDKSDKKVRKGQAKLRQRLVEKYQRCQISEIKYEELLIASHIKPYSISNEDEKYDLNNALLLNAIFDRLLDLGLMSFDKDNYLLFSDILPNEDIYKLKRNIVHYCPDFSEKQKEYIEFHHNNIFRVVNGPITTNYTKS